MISEDDLQASKQIDNRRVFAFGDFSFDSRDKVLWRGERLVSLPPKTCELLGVLVENAGRLMTKDELMRRVWQGTYVEEANLSHHIAVLRKSLGEEKNGKNFIVTVPRKGYRFVAQLDDPQRDTLEVMVRERTRTEIIEELEIESEPSDAQNSSALDAARGSGPYIRRAAFAVVVATLMIAGGAIFWVRWAADAPVDRVARLLPVTHYTGHELAPAISPDGQFVAYCGTDTSTSISKPNEPRLLSAFNIYVKQADGESVLQLTDKQGRAMNPAWSPDGRFIAYAQRFPPETGRENTLFVIPALGGREQTIYEARDLSYVAWSPDGKTLAFGARNTNEGPHCLSTISLETREVRQITFPAEGDDTDPNFSPDGNSISFTRIKSKTAEVFVVPANGGEPRQITSDNRNVLGNAVWTPDGERLIFGSTRVGGSYRLWQVPVAGGTARLVTGAGEPAYDPSISASGTRMAYTRMEIDFHIWRVPLENRKGIGERAEKIVASSRQNRCPAISPDGGRISFVSNQDSPARQVWIADADGQHQKQLTNFTDGTIATRTAWSPDGTHLVFDAATGDSSAIYLLNVDRGVPVKLTDGTSDALAPSWSRDGGSIYFTQKRGDGWQVWKMSVAGGDAEQVTRNGGYEAQESPDGSFLYFNKALYGTLGIFRQATDGTTGEEKVLDLIQADSLGEWFLTDGGIYFLFRSEANEEPAADPRIRYFDLVSRRLTDVRSLGFNPFGHPGVSVSPDGRWLYYSVNEKSDIDVMLVENFQ